MNKPIYYLDSVAIKAVKEDGLNLQYVDKQTQEICLIAVKQNGNALKYVLKQTEDICMEAVKQDGNAVQYVDNSIFREK